MSTKLSDLASIEKLIEEMTLEEKALLLTGKTQFGSRGFRKYGIPSIRFIDSAAGVNFFEYFLETASTYKKSEDEETEYIGASMNAASDYMVGNDLIQNFLTPEKLTEGREAYQYFYDHIMPKGKHPTAFADGTALGATWNPELVRRTGQVLGREAAAYDVDVMLGTPNINIHRDPLNGRLCESFSEDPCLVSKLAPELVKGVQENHVVANVKHFAANNQETLRIGIDEIIPERALREIYLPGFEACVKEGKAQTVMSAYNKINGTACALNPWLLTEVLREEWGFGGFVVSDWGGAYDKAKAIAAGNDMDMPGPRDVTPVLEALEKGELSQEQVDESVRRYLRVLVTILENRQKRKKDFDETESLKIAYDTAVESAVLLKNDNHLLPLDKTSKVAFFGEKSRFFEMTSQGSAVVYTHKNAGLYQNVADKIGQERVAFGSVSEDTDVVVITAYLSSREGYDHEQMRLDEGEQSRVVKEIRDAKRLGKKVVFLLNSGNPVELGEFIEDVDAVIWVFFPGSEGGHAVADLLFGDANFSGKLPLTWPKRYLDTPTSTNFPGECGTVVYGEGIYVGYRYYDKKEIEPQFPFGYGLSYTSFAISNLTLSKDCWDKTDSEGLCATVTVENTGSMAGKEVIQLYIAQEESSIPKPMKELKAFAKVELEPGEKKNVSLQLELKDIMSYNVQHQCWDCEPGVYYVLVGNSSRNITCKESFRLTGHSIYDYGADTQMVRISRDPKAREVVSRHLGKLMPPETFFTSFDFTPYNSFRSIWDQFLGAFDPDTKKVFEQVFQEICEDLKEVHTG